MAHGELRDLVIEINKALHNHLTGSRAPAFLRVLPCGLDVRLGLERALPLAAARHDRLHHARQSNPFDGRQKFLLRCGKFKGRRAQPQLLRRQPPDAFAIHCKLRSPRSGDDFRQPFRLNRCQRIRRNRLHLRHHKMRFFLLDHRPQCIAIKHRYHMRAIRHLHRWRVGVGVHCNHFHAVALQLDDHFLAQLA